MCEITLKNITNNIYPGNVTDNFSFNEKWCYNKNNTSHTAGIVVNNITR